MHNRARFLWEVILCVATLALSAASLVGQERAVNAPLPEGAILRLGSLRFHAGVFLRSLGWSDDGQRLFTTSFDRFCVWNSQTGELFNCVSLVSKRNVAFDGERLTDGRVHLWDSKTGKKTSSSVGHDGRVRCLAWQRNGAVLVSSGEDATIIVWDAIKLARGE